MKEKIVQAYQSNRFGGAISITPVLTNPAFQLRLYITLRGMKILELGASPA